MKCPWCNNDLKPVFVNLPTPGDPRETNTPTERMICLSCETEGTRDWWKDRIKDQRGLPKGDR